MTTEEVLLAARDYIREHGMCRNRMRDKKDRVCMYEAVSVISHYFNGDIVDVVRNLSRECIERFGVESIPANDFVVTDLDEACEIFESAAKRAANS